MIELIAGFMLTTSVHLYASFNDRVVYIKADQVKIYLTPKKEVKKHD